MKCCLGAHIDGYGHSRNCQGDLTNFADEFSDIIKDYEKLKFEVDRLNAKYDFQLLVKKNEMLYQASTIAQVALKKIRDEVASQYLTLSALHPKAVLESKYDIAAKALADIEALK